MYGYGGQMRIDPTRRCVGAVSRRGPLVLAMSVLLALGTPTYAADPNQICPPGLEGKFNASRYTFEFQSWSWRTSTEPNTRFICHCVRNEAELPLWMEWENTGLSGMVKVGTPSYARRAIAHDAVRHIPSKFWYGPQPQQIDTQVVVPQADQRASLTSDGVLSIPTDYALAKSGWGRSPQQNLLVLLTEYQYLLRDRRGLQTVEVSFSAENRDRGTSYDLRIAAPPDHTMFDPGEVRTRAYIWVRISNPQLHTGIFKHSGPVPLRAFAPPIGYDALPAVLSENGEAGSFSTELPVSDRKNEARLLFLGPDAKTVLASMPLGLSE